MSYSWILPGSSSAPTPSTPAPTTGPSSATTSGGLFDQEVDPASFDFIDTPDGGWAETADSRSIVLCQLEIWLGKSYAFPGDGTSIKERMSEGDPVTIDDAIADVRRAMGVLAAAGILILLDVQGRDSSGAQLVDETGRPAMLLSWIDLATGSPVDLVYRPQGG